MSNANPYYQAYHETWDTIGDTSVVHQNIHNEPIITTHMLERMAMRNISMYEVHRCLQDGVGIGRGCISDGHVVVCFRNGCLISTWHLQRNSTGNEPSAPPIVKNI
jgi:hypothetical protein